MVDLPSRQPDPYLYNILAWTGAAVETLRVSTHTISTKPTDTPANTVYRGLIRDVGVADYAIFEGTATSGKASVDAGWVEMANTGALDAWLSYGWGRAAELYTLPTRDTPVATGTLLMRMLVQGIETPDAMRRLRLRLRSRMHELDFPLLTERYLGTTVSSSSAALTEGDSDLEGQLKPRCFGQCFNVPGFLVNKFNLVYQFALGPVEGITVYDGGIELTDAGDFATAAALIAATIAPGQFGQCRAEGLARLGAEAAFMVTADVIEGAAASDRSASKIAQRIMTLVPTVVSGDLSAASFAAFHSFNPAEVSLYVQDESTAIDLVSRVADSVGGAVVVDQLGVFKSAWLSDPTAVTPDASYTLRDMLEASMQLFTGPSSEGQGVPAWKVVLDWGPIWQTQTSGQLAPRIESATDGADLARKQFLSRQFRTVSASDSAVKTAHPLAVQLNYETLLKDQSAAQAEAARRLALHKVRRDRIALPLSFASDVDKGNIDLGEVVELTLARHYPAGKRFRVLGREDNFRGKVRTLRLWG